MLQRRCWYQSKFVSQTRVSLKKWLPTLRTHIPIFAPQEYHCNYFNRKGWHSIILQGVVDGKGLFWNRFAELPGNLHDAQVLRLSSLWELTSRGNHFPACTRNIGEVNVGYYILGDSAYPLQNWLLKPCRAWVVVENAFGRLKGRWRCHHEKK